MNDYKTTSDRVFCIICKQMIAFSDATAGSLYADNRQAFACSAHIAERARWTLAWIAFDIDQHTVHEQEGAERRGRTA